MQPRGRWWMRCRLLEKQRHWRCRLDKQNKHTIHVTGHQKVGLVLCRREQTYSSQQVWVPRARVWTGWSCHSMSKIGLSFLRPKGVVASYGESRANETQLPQANQCPGVFSLWVHFIKRALLTIFPTVYTWVQTRKWLTKASGLVSGVAAGTENWRERLHLVYPVLLRQSQRHNWPLAPP